MKKRHRVLAFAIALVFFLTSPAFAFTWVTANQATVQWDAVTTDVDGDPLTAGTHAEYKVFLVNKITDPGKTNPAEVVQTDLLEFTITLNTKGQYLVGVKTVQIEDSTGDLLAESAMSWSDIPADCQGGVDFGLRFFAALQKTLIGPKP